MLSKSDLKAVAEIVAATLAARSGKATKAKEPEAKKAPRSGVVEVPPHKWADGTERKGRNAGEALLAFYQDGKCAAIMGAPKIKLVLAHLKAAEAWAKKQ